MTSSPALTAKAFTDRLKAIQSDVELEKIKRYFKSGKGEYGEGDKFMGVRMGSLFALSKEFVDMPVKEIEKLLESKIHEIRAGAVSIMNQAGRLKKITPERRKELYDLYIRRHDRINNWDLVDLGAAYVVGAYLHDKPRDVLYKLAYSRDMWERRTAITATWYFVRLKDTADTFKLAAILVNDREDLIHKAVGGWLRAAGGPHPKELIKFLDRHAATMPRTMLRYALERLPKKQKEYYMQLEKA
ncbi:MAG TPA: DNA alkylation repair protein [Chryseolinea sp.]|nr:DNA alkylation repair protein [Chryseolinea sp.]